MSGPVETVEHASPAPWVSILIPAFRATYLRQAIASVLAQGFEDFELLISDDSLGDEVGRVVEGFRDPRIRYFRTSGAIGAGENCCRLWGEARYSLVKYLFDDDVLLPYAMALLMREHQNHPGAAFYFGHRYIMDHTGLVRSEPKMMADGKGASLDRAILSQDMVPYLRNRVGEFSNVLMNRAAGYGLEALTTYRGFQLDMITDVAFYMNAAEHAPAWGVGVPISGFRRHAQQRSSQGWNPRFAKGVAEWDLFLRGEYGAGVLSQDQALAGLNTLQLNYQELVPNFPELMPFQTGLEELRAQVLAEERDVLGETFRAAWQELDARVLDRETARTSVA